MNKLAPYFLLLICNPVIGATVDFEDATGVGQLCEQIESDGFGFSPTGGVCPQLYNLSASGSTTSLHVTTYESSTYEMASLSGGSFSLESLDAISLGSGIFLTGFYAAGGTVVFYVDHPSEWTTYNLDSSWQGLQKVEFSFSAEPFGASIDNLVVTAVPIPAAVWMFGSALAGLGWLGRKKTV